MPSIDDFVNSNKKSQAFHTLYISPLKALTTDVQRNLLNPINSLKIDIKVETRTSDTSAYNKEKQIKQHTPRKKNKKNLFLKTVK